MAGKSLSPDIKAVVLSDKQNTISVMVEIIKLRRAIENNPIAESAAIDEAIETLPGVGVKISTLR